MCPCIVLRTTLNNYIVCPSSHRAQHCWRLLLMTPFEDENLTSTPLNNSKLLSVTQSHTTRELHKASKRSILIPSPVLGTQSVNGPIDIIEERSEVKSDGHCSNDSRLWSDTEKNITQVILNNEGSYNWQEIPISNPEIAESSTLELENHTIPSSESSTKSSKVPSRMENTVHVHSDAVVLVRDAIKSYGNNPPILKNLCMTVNKGTIYTLLGSSGCGKTTLLNCILGLRFLNSGSISVFGASPGTEESGVPGKRVGYMPQELAVHEDFTLKEAFHYYAKLYGMTAKGVQESQDFLIKFLDLPDPKTIIGTLSGGQKRRTSLALSLIHSPELLILDEPTVGVDPLLRQSIWMYLHKIVKNCTIIITTHYFEEARQSSKIGIMRDGRLLAEKSPEALLAENETPLLEDVVLKLCHEDMSEGKLDSIQVSLDKSIKPSSNVVDGNKSVKKETSLSSKLKNVICKTPEVSNRISALTTKNFKALTRNYILLAFMLVVPAIEVFLICIAIGNDPKPLWMGVVNHDTSHPDWCITQYNNATPHEGCDIENLSCKLLSTLPKDVLFFRNYATDEEARNAVKSGDIWGFLSFPLGYSDNVYTRSAGGNLIDGDALNGSFILIQMDMSNKQISGTIKSVLYNGYQKFAKELLQSCGFNPDMAQSPLKYLDPIYGDEDTNFREFIGPNVLLGVLFFFPLCTSGISFIVEKKQGTLERARVAGVKTWEIMVAFFISEGTVLLLQALLGFTILRYVFSIYIHGSVILILLLALLMGLEGVSMGFLIASICTQETQAVLLSLAILLPNALLTGTIWPLEGMPLVMQRLCYALPTTLPGEAVRSIVTRGWGFSHRNVWPGFAIGWSWVVVCWILTVIIHKIVLSKR